MRGEILEPRSALPHKEPPRARGMIVDATGERDLVVGIRHEAVALDEHTELDSLLRP